MNNEKIKELKIDYNFNSDYFVEDEYQEYDGVGFEYKIDVDEAKEVIVESYIELVNGNGIDCYHFVKIINELEDEELIDWNKMYNKNWDILKEHFERKAMEWFRDQHYIETKEDYEANQADAYNDEKWLEEHGE